MYEYARVRHVRVVRASLRGRVRAWFHACTRACVGLWAFACVILFVPTHSFTLNNVILTSHIDPEGRIMFSLLTFRHKNALQEIGVHVGDQLTFLRPPPAQRKPVRAYEGWNMSPQDAISVLSIKYIW